MRNPLLHKVPEYRLKSSGGQDRSVNRRNARTTDKGCENRRRYSLLSRNNLLRKQKEKRELTYRLMEHNGKIPETSFLRLLPDEIEQFMGYMKGAVSVQLGTGQLGTVTSDTNHATGLSVVDHIERFEIGQKVTLDDDDSAAADYYVTAINVNTDTITVSATRGGAAANISAYTVAQNAKFFYDGADTASFVSIRSALLSAANGGTTNLHGVAKTAHPILQAVNVDGSSITETNILDKIFDSYTEVRRRAKGNARTVLMSYKNLGSVMKSIETQRGQYKTSEGSMKANIYGWTEIEITSVKGSLMVVGLHEWDDDVIAFIDWGSMKFFSNGMFKKRTSPDGDQYFEVRNTTGYQYIVDVSLFGELVHLKPGQNGIIYGISY